MSYMDKTVKIVVDNAGIGSVHIDDLNISNSVTAVSVDVRPNSITKITLEMACDVEITAPLELVEAVYPVAGRTRYIRRSDTWR